CTIFLILLLFCPFPFYRAFSKSHSRVGLKSSTKQKTSIFSTLASEKSLSDCKKLVGSYWVEEASLQMG
uniref:Uncharacterized protein n=1 Tax=Panthera tigris altaica TaxID=74533 RepID=A0A8C9KLT1_PANTA